jgi:hypothetical protein
MLKAYKDYLKKMYQIYILCQDSEAISEHA